IEAIRQFNPQINIQDINTEFSNENDHLFDDDFWTSKDLILSAANCKACSNHIGNKSIWHHLPIIDSGTKGLLAHVEFIIPEYTSALCEHEDYVQDFYSVNKLSDIAAKYEKFITDF